MDKYSLNARIYPVILFILPVLLVAIVFSLHFETYLQMGVSIGITGALAFLFSQIGRDMGKRKEKSLWVSWGGAPTTQLLRWSNDDVDVITKKRYHAALFRCCPADHIPDRIVENGDPKYADTIYSAWTRYLIGATRDTAKYSMLFRENVNYGFRRNLWGMKLPAIVLIVLLMGGIFSYYRFLVMETELPKTFFISEALLLMFLVFWVFLVNRSWVRIPAFAYAHRLLETTDSVTNEQHL